MGNCTVQLLILLGWFAVIEVHMATALLKLPVSNSLSILYHQVGGGELQHVG